MRHGPDYSSPFLSRLLTRRLLTRRAVPPLAAAFAVALAALVIPDLADADPDALWRIVNDRCVPSQIETQSPRPCEQVTAVKAHANQGQSQTTQNQASATPGDLHDGYAILKDRCGATQYLLIPTRRVTGIESPELLDAPNYFAYAWQARSYTLQRAERQVTPDEIGLTLNAPAARSQNQLHIHIDLVRPDVRQALQAHARDPLGSWAPVKLVKQPYQVMRVLDLESHNPVKLLAERLARTGGQMRDHTLAVIGATFPDGKSGFYIISGQVDLAQGQLGHSEDLQISHKDCRYGTT
jgi:CDP-diacylglycerol pyrophosphatase